MRIRVLGAIEVLEPAGVVLGGPTQRRVLAVLLVHANHLVSIDQMVDAVWPDGDAPDRAGHNVRTYVHRLRTALGPDGDRIETAGPGYRLRIERDALDATQFEDRVADARRAATEGNIDRARQLLDEAFGLWEGRPYDEFAEEDWARAESVRLNELRASAVEHRFAALLDAGRHTEVVGSLQEAVDAEPWREARRGQLALALYRSGRQAEALRSIQVYRAQLADELGLDASPDLDELEHRILAHDPGLLPASHLRHTLRGYELDQVIGEGAFSLVWRGTQPSLGRTVAIKQIRAELANQPDFIRRFETEAQTVASLEHPHIVPLYDYWREPDSAYLVMRYVSGGSLESEVLTGGLNHDRLRRLLEQIGSALHVAHRAGVIHRDVKAANVLTDGDGNFYLTDFGIAFTGADDDRLAASLSTGSPAYASPEQLRRQDLDQRTDVYGFGITLFEAATGRLPFADAPTQAVLVQRQLDVPVPAPSSTAPGIPAWVDEVVARATAKNPADRYSSVTEMIAAVPNESALAGHRLGTPLVTGALVNPFKALRSFRESDAADFHGRDRLVARFVEVLARPGTAGRLLAVVGPSGSGKSSAVRSGLIPALRSGAVDGSGDWFITTMLPGGDPFHELESALSRIAVRQPGPIVEMMRSDPRGIARAVNQVLPEEDSELVLIVDQFEEAFTLTDAAERTKFIDGLLAAIREPRGRLRVVVTIRADFWDRPLRHPGLAARLESAAITVSPLAADELEAAIVEPVRRQGAAYEPGLVARIVADVGDQPGALPLLQYALTELFDTNVSGLIRAEAYAEIGGLTGALAQRAEETFDTMTTSAQLASRRAFLRLVAFGDGSEDTRRRVQVTELGDEVETAHVIEAFGAARLLVFDRHPVTREATVEIAHEALLRAWPRLRSWLDDDRDSLRTHRHLTEAARAWVVAGRDRGELYRGGRLEAAESWATDRGDDLSNVEREFLEASLAARDTERLAERLHLEQQASSNRRLRRLTVVAAVVAAIALIAGTFALRQQTRADDEAAAARTQAADAVTARREAESAQALADQNATEALDSAADAAAARVAADQSALDANQQADAAEAARAQGDLERIRAVALSTAGQSPTVAALLAVESNRLAPSTDSLDVLHRVMTEIPGFRGSVPGGPYFDAVLLDDDVTLVAAGAESIDVWDLESRERLTTIDHPSPSANATVVAVDDHRIAALDGGRMRTFLYDVRTGSVEQIDHAGIVNDLSVSADGRQLASALETGTVEVWDLDTFELVTTLETGADDVYISRWSPTDDLLAVATLRFEVQLWDVDQQTRLWTTEPTEAGIVNQVRPYAAAFSPDGRRLVFVSGSVSGGIRTIATSDGTDVGTPVATPGLRGFPLDDLYWIDDATIAIPSFANVRAFSLGSPSSSTTVLDQFVLQANAVMYSATIDQHVIAGLGGIEFWSADGSGPLERVIPIPPEQTAALDAGGGPVLASLSADGTRLIMSTVRIPSGPPATSFDLTTDPPTAEVLDPLVTIGFGEYTLVATPGFMWQLLDADLAPLGPPVALPFDFSEVAASEDGRYVAIGRLGGLADVYTGSGDFVDTVELGDPAEFAGSQVQPTFTSDGRYLVVGTTDGRSGVWATDGLARIDRPDEHENSWTVALGRWLFTASDGGAFQRFEPASMEPIDEPIGLSGLGALGYAKLDEPHLRLAATGSEVVKVFDLTSERQLGRDLPFGGGANRVEFSADGAMLSVPTADRITLWNFDTDTWVDIACEMAGRNLTRDEWEQLGPRTIGYRATCDQFPIET